MNNHRGVAAFDFDGTLVPGDSLPGSWPGCSARPPSPVHWPRPSPAMMIGYHQAGRDGSKAALLRRALAGTGRDPRGRGRRGVRRQPGPPDSPGDGRTAGLAPSAGAPPGAGVRLAGGLPGTVRTPDRLRRGHRHPPRDRPGRAPHRPHGRPQRACPQKAVLLRADPRTGPGGGVGLWRQRGRPGDAADGRPSRPVSDPSRPAACGIGQLSR